MKPKTKIDKRAAAASRHLPRLTAAQVRWAKKELLPHVGYWCANRVWCSECGGVFDKADSNRLVDILDDEAICPHCGCRLKVEKSRKLKEKECAYFSIITTCKGMQVIRTFFVQRVGRKDCGVDYKFNEVMQQWLDERGKSSVIACSFSAFNGYCRDAWLYNTFSTKKATNSFYNFQGLVYPRRHVLKILKRNGYTPVEGVIDWQVMRLLLTEPKAETLIKCGQFGLLKYMCNRNWSAENCWHAVKVAIRNGYIINDGPSWVDYIRNLQELGLDDHSPHYVCPADLNVAHDIMQKRVRRKREREWLEEKLRKAAEDNKKYIAEKARYFGLMITNGEIKISPLKSVTEFLEEGKAMHHCVFTNGYYELENALILSVRNQEERRLATIELNLETFKVVQCRGVNNSIPPLRNKILSLIDNNIHKIKKLAKQIS